MHLHFTDAATVAIADSADDLFLVGLVRAHLVTNSPLRFRECASRVSQSLPNDWVRPKYTMYHILRICQAGLFGKLCLLREKLHCYINTIRASYQHITTAWGSLLLPSLILR